ncbi:STAS domain-containing protein [Nonomuraea gerenzanensis]|uniref:STAS domain-containing protein n=1 Tax=Nonomuraea gerenzanensis TaxID=93944 RepID=UPI001CD94FA4|nr:STAS domain-containing protein [Nonomuraea gerenzanensis]UBU13198.1 STAS domain-containing protein [Nonomuraea gerenzanensis]
MNVQDRLLYQDEQLTILTSAAPPEQAILLIGEIDATNSAALASTLAGCRSPGGYLVVDTGELRFIDVSGLRVLVMPTVPASQRWIRLHNVTPYQRRLLRMMGWFYQPRCRHAPL